MSAIFANVLPVFILILVGWMLAATRYLKEDVGEALGSFVFKVAIPCLLFLTLGKDDFTSASPVKLWVAYFGGIGLAWMVGQILTKTVFKRDARASIVGAFAACFSNLGFIGLPLISSIFGHDGLAVVSLILAIHLPLMMTVSVVLMENQANKEAARSASATVRKVFGTLIRNPIIVAILFSLAIRFSDAPIPGSIELVASKIAGVAGPAGLIAVGMSLRRYPVAGNVTAATVISGLKLVFMPLAVLVLAKFLGLPDVWTMSAVLAATMPTGVNAWLLANQFDTGRNLAASVITITTALGVVTVSIWSAILGVGL